MPPPKSSSRPFRTVNVVTAVVVTTAIAVLSLGVFSVKRAYSSALHSPAPIHFSLQMSAEVRSRARAAVIGGFVADAATMPLHWIYDAAKIEQLVDGGDPEFYPSPSCPFYKAPVGDLSPYGAETLFLLKSVVEHNGVDGPKLVQDLATSFGEYNGYLNGSSKKLVANVNGGKTFPDAAAPDSQANCLTKVPIVVARYVGQPEMREKVKEAIAAHQAGSMPLEFGLAMASVLEAVLLGAPVPEALLKGSGTAPASTQDAFRQAAAATHSSQADVTKSIKQFGTSCALPGSFMGPLVVAAYAPDYKTAVRANILASGDQASRAIALGAIMAAAGGEASIPTDWVQKVTLMPEISALVDEVLKQRFEAH